MRKIVVCAAALAIVGLTGCSTVLKHQAMKDAQAQCAAKGLQFVPTKTEQTEAIVVSSASVAGECVGPNDPRYVPEQK